MQEPIIIMNRPFWARALLLLCVIELVMGSLFIYGGAAYGSSIALTLGILIVALFAGLAWFSWPSAWLRGAVIEMGAEGLRDRRLSETVIPWETIRWKILFNGRSYSLKFDVAEPTLGMLRPSLPRRSLALLNRLVGYPAFTMATLGTGLSSHQLAARMERFKPACN